MEAERSLAIMKALADESRLAIVHSLLWQQKLQPFGERGYNSLKGFQREIEQLKPTR